MVPALLVHTTDIKIFRAERGLDTLASDLHTDRFVDNLLMLTRVYL